MAITAEHVGLLTELPLEELSLHQTDASVDELLRLKDSSTLRTLQLDYDFRVPSEDAALSRLQAAMPNVRVLRDNWPLIGGPTGPDAVEGPLFQD